MVMAKNKVDRAQAIPVGAEVWYQGNWHQVNNAVCVPPYQFVVWEIADRALQIPVVQHFLWRVPSSDGKAAAKNKEKSAVKGRSRTKGKAKER